jgi:hypothetical protein
LAVEISPVSISCLKRRKLAARLDLRLLLEELGDQLAQVAAGRLVDDGGGDLGPAPGRGVLELDAAGVLDVGALGGLPGQDLVLDLFGQDAVPLDRLAGRGLDHPVRAPVVARRDALDVLHEQRQVPEIAPERVELGARAIDRDGAADQGGFVPAALFGDLVGDVALVHGGGQRASLSSARARVSSDMGCSSCPLSTTHATTCSYSKVKDLI